MKKSFVYSIVLSVVLHLVAFITAFFIRFSVYDKQDMVVQSALTDALEMRYHEQVDLGPLPPEPEAETISETIKQDIIDDIPEPPEPQIIQSDAVVFSDSLVEPPMPDTLDSTTHNKLYMIDTTFLAKGKYIVPRDSLGRDTTAASRRIFVMDDKGMLKPVDLPSSPIDANIPRLLYQGAKKLGELLEGDKGPLRFDFVPSHAQIEALAQIWDQKRITDQSIYARMDTSLKITAEDLNSLLSVLTQKGLLKRRIVSPEYKVTFFIAEVEVSPKNIRNRVWEYEPLVTREEMRRFLNALYYQLKTGMEPDLKLDTQTLPGPEQILKLIERLYPAQDDD